MLLVLRDDPGDPGAAADDPRHHPASGRATARRRWPTSPRSYAGAQAFAGPVLVVPYTETVEVEEADKYNIVAQGQRERDPPLDLLPDHARRRGPLQPSTRKRGLHEVRVYEWQASATRALRRAHPGRRERRHAQDRPALAELRHRRRARPVGTPRLRIDGAPATVDEGLGQPRRRRRCTRDWPTPQAGRARAADRAGLRAGRHRIARAGAAGQEQHVRAAVELAAPAVRRQLPAARARVGDAGLQARPGRSRRWRATRSASTCRRSLPDGRTAAATRQGQRPRRVQRRADRPGQHLLAGRPRHQVRAAVRAADLRRLLHLRADQAAADPPDPVRAGRAGAGDLLPAAGQPERAHRVLHRPT